MRLPFKILGVNHLGLAPKDPAKTVDFFNLLNLVHIGDELIPDQKTNTSIFSSGNDDGARLEILSNQPGEDGPIKAFMQKKGGGIHHVALTVDNVATALSFLQQHGVELVDKEPRAGAHRTKIGFVHPRATGGILVELVEQT